MERQRRDAPLTTPTDLTRSATKDIAAAMNAILADVFAFYLKTKNFHWHMSGPHFRDYHLLLDEQGDQLFAMTDPIAERIRKVGGPTLKSNRKQRLLHCSIAEIAPRPPILTSVLRLLTFYFLTLAPDQIILSGDMAYAGCLRVSHFAW